MSSTIYTKKKWVVYLTIYSGDLLPRRYIGYTYQERIDEGYNGTVSSKDYKSIWLSERKNNSHLFKTRVIKRFDTEDEAIKYEREIQTKYDVVKSDDYINRCIWPVFCKADRSIAVIDPDGKIFVTLNDAGLAYKVSPSTISYWIKDKVGWRYANRDNASDEDKLRRIEIKRIKGDTTGAKNPNARSVIDPDGKIFVTLNDAGLAYGVSGHGILKWIRTKVGWGYAEGVNVSDEDKRKQMKIVEENRILVKQKLHQCKGVIDPDGKKFISFASAGKAHKVSAPTIERWVRTKVGWGYAEGDNISDEDKRKQMKVSEWWVSVIDPDGKIFVSLTEAGLAYGVSKNSIRRWVKANKDGWKLEDKLVV